MALVEVKVPDIGDFDEVAVIELLVKVGDTVKAEQSLITVESDKASMEIPSSTAGVVKELRVKLGGTAFFANIQTTVLIFLPPATQIWNRNSEASQIAFAAANGSTTVGTGTAATTGTVNTAAATTLAISGQKAVGTDTLRLYAYSVELVRP